MYRVFPINVIYPPCTMRAWGNCVKPQFGFSRSLGILVGALVPKVAILLPCCGAVDWSMPWNIQRIGSNPHHSSCGFVRMGSVVQW